MVTQFHLSNVWRDEASWPGGCDGAELLTMVTRRQGVSRDTYPSFEGALSVTCFLQLGPTS